MTFIEELRVSSDLHISQFKQTRLVKKENKRPLRSLDRPSLRSAQQRWLSKDSVALSDYRFENVQFNCDIPAEVFLNRKVNRLGDYNILHFPK